MPASQESLLRQTQAANLVIPAEASPSHAMLELSSADMPQLPLEGLGIDVQPEGGVQAAPAVGNDNLRVFGPALCLCLVNS